MRGEPGGALVLTRNSEVEKSSAINWRVCPSGTIRSCLPHGDEICRWRFRHEDVVLPAMPKASQLVAGGRAKRYHRTQTRIADAPRQGVPASTVANPQSRWHTSGVHFLFLHQPVVSLVARSTTGYRLATLRVVSGVIGQLLKRKIQAGIRNSNGSSAQRTAAANASTLSSSPNLLRFST